MTQRKTNGMTILGAVAAAASIVAGPHRAQAQVIVAEPPEDTFVFVSNAAPITPFGGRVEWISGMGTVPGAVVTGKPYSAEAVTESTQMLADGNRITQRNETRIYRDGQGRTRREQTLGGLGVWQPANEPATTITIHDPVAGTTYMMNPGTETAHAIGSFKLTAAEFHAEASEAGLVAQIDGLESGSVAATPAPAGAVAGVRVEARDVVIEAEGSPPPHVGSFEVPLPHPAAGVAAFPPMAMISAVPFAPGEVTTEDLGEQILEGVLVRGSRETRTIPAGAIGNERPIDIVMERWYSDELEAEVLRRNVDPRFGETTYQLVNVVLGEPSADLFVVPESYELQAEESPRFEFKLQRPGPGSAPAR